MSLHSQAFVEHLQKKDILKFAFGSKSVVFGEKAKKGAAR